MRLYDTHIHLCAAAWKLPLPLRIQQLEEVGVDQLLVPGVSADGWDELASLGRRFPGVVCAPGLHPLSAADWNCELELRLRRLCRHSAVVAIGEIGLDGSAGADETLQMKAFRAQLQVAADCGLPVLIHCRHRTGALIQELRQAGTRLVGGIWHGFSGSLETAEQLIDLGMLIGVGPVLLRRNARKLPEVVRRVPPEALVLETDAPDMTPEPAALVRVAERLAELRSWSLEETARITTANARRLLHGKDNQPQ